MNSRLKLLFAVMPLAMFLTGCGFQLRGANALPNVSSGYAVQVKSPYPHLNHQFERELHRLGFKVVSSEPQYVIEVRNQSYDHLEFNTTDSLSKVFKRINFHFRYAVFDSSGKLLISPRTSVVSSDYFNPTGGNHLQMLVAEDDALERLRGQAAAMIANQLIAEISGSATNSE